MSNGSRNPYHYDPFDYNHHETDRSSSFTSLFNYGTNYYPPPPLDPPQPRQTLDGFEPDHHPDPSLMSFTDCLHGSTDYTALSKAFDLSCSSSEVISPPLDHHDHSSAIQQHGVAGAGDRHPSSENPSTPNSSVSYSSNEARENDHQDQTAKKEKQPKLGSEEGAEDEEDKSNKGNKGKKKEKKKREPRFAFLTKSEVDQLEDGYRWRKYGQKAVKNSPYPRSYYRCTTQKCIVKKRVERSFQDPTIVITTYEGQHSHQSPATLRGNLNLNAGGPGMLSHNSLLASASLNGVSRFPHDFLSQFFPMTNQLQAPSHLHGQDQQARNSMSYSNLMTPRRDEDRRHHHHHHHHHHHQEQPQQLHAPDYGLLHDLVQSFDHKQEH